MTKISLSTLHRWKKQYEEEKIIGKQIRNWIREKEYEKALEMSTNFPNNVIIQSQVITIYIERKEYEKAIEIGQKYLNNPTIQSQMMTIYIEMKEYEKAIEIGEKFLEDSLIKGQMQFVKKINNMASKKKEKLNDNKLNIIRSKILLNTITLNDINLLNDVKDKTLYLFVMSAIYERLNLKKKCIETLKMIPNYNKKKMNQLIRQIQSCKTKYYNIQKWDSIIGWSIDDVDTYLEEKQKKEFANRTCQIKKEPISINLPIKEAKKETKKETIISGCFQKKEAKKNNHNFIEVKQEKNEPTIYEQLTNQYKQMVYYLKLQYYKEMYDPVTKKDAIFKYDRLEEVLLEKASNQKAFRQLLIMLIGAGYSHVVENDYQEEYEVIVDQINSKKQQIKLLTKKG